MKSVLIYSANENSTQNILQAAYNANFDPETEVDPKTMISYDEDGDTYALKYIAIYPHVFSRSGQQSVVTLKLTDAQYDFLLTLPNAYDVLAIDDNNPDTDYVWKAPEAVSEAKFKSVLGQDFFTGSGTIGDPDYVAPRSKLAVLG